MKLRCKRAHAIRAAQKGAVLAVTLALLTILTLFALAAGQSVRTKEQTLLSMSDGKECFALAEAALRAGELEAREHATFAPESNLSVPLGRQNWTAPERVKESWWREHGRPISISPQRGKNSFYTIEVYERESSQEYFRITAASFSPHSSPVMLQSIYAVRSSSNEEMGCDRQSEQCSPPREGRQSWLQLR